MDSAHSNNGYGKGKASLSIDIRRAALLTTSQPLDPLIVGWSTFQLRE